MILTIETKVTDENGNVLNVTSYQVNTDVTTEPVVDASAVIQAVVEKYGAPFGADVTPEQVTAWADSVDATVLYDFTKELTFTIGGFGGVDYDAELAILLPLQGDHSALKANFLRLVAHLSA